MKEALEVKSLRLSAGKEVLLSLGCPPPHRFQRRAARGMFREWAEGGLHGLPPAPPLQYLRLLPGAGAIM